MTNRYLILPTLQDDTHMSWFVFVVRLNDLFGPGDRDVVMQELRAEGHRLQQLFPADPSSAVHGRALRTSSPAISRSANMCRPHAGAAVLQPDDRPAGRPGLRRAGSGAGAGVGGNQRAILIRENDRGARPSVWQNAIGVCSTAVSAVFVRGTGRKANSSELDADKPATPVVQKCPNLAAPRNGPHITMAALRPLKHSQQDSLHADAISFARSSTLRGSRIGTSWYRAILPSLSMMTVPRLVQLYGSSPAHMP